MFVKSITSDSYSIYIRPYGPFIIRTLNFGSNLWGCGINPLTPIGECGNSNVGTRHASMTSRYSDVIETMIPFNNCRWRRCIVEKSSVTSAI